MIEKIIEARRLLIAGSLVGVFTALLGWWLNHIDIGWAAAIIAGCYLFMAIVSSVDVLPKSSSAASGSSLHE